MSMYQTYTISRGDTLAKIARRFGVTVQALQQLNGIADPDRIGAGQLLRVRKISEDYAVGGDSAPTAPVVPAADTQRLGNLSRRYEVSSGGPGTVSHGVGDNGGVSYGSYQLASRMGRPADFLAHEGKPWAARFGSARQGTPEFTRIWKQIATEERDIFGKAQHEYIKRTHYDVQMDHIRAQTGLDLGAFSHALKDVVWSTAVQHGPSSGVIAKVVAALGQGPDTPGFEKELIIAIYAERGRVRPDGRLAYFRSSSPRFQAGVADRFRSELKDALEMLAAETTRRALVPPAEAAEATAAAARPGAAADADAILDRAARALSDDDVRLLVERYGDHEALNDFLAGRRVAIALRKSTNWRLHPKGKYDDLIIVAWREVGGAVKLERFMGNTEPAGIYAHGAASAHKGSSTDLDGDGRKDLGRLVPGTYHYELQSGAFLGAAFWRARNVQEAERDTNHDGLFIVATGEDIVDPQGAGRSMLIHQGGESGTWSAGCQTIPGSRYDDFMALMRGQTKLSYILINAD